jgi:predicted RNA-binding Zn-ribbon protein involved in translation (DUF1610 family)
MKVGPRYPRLRCPQCGNDDRFIEVMAHESHLVDADLNYIRLILAETEYYECPECGERFDPPEEGECRS